jgi:glycosyltransferase involved in cell wall biosynthesis
VAYWVHSTRSLFLHPDARRVDLRARRVVDWLAVKRAGMLIANSRFTALQLRELYSRDADAVIYPGVDLATFSPGEREPTCAITVGRISAEKGLDRLVEIWRELPDLPLHIVGEGPESLVRELRRRAPSNVVFRGRLDGPELVEAYRSAAVAIFTPYREEFGLAPLEAMASGVPVVAWREGGLNETVVEGRTGYLVTDGVTLRQRVRLLLHDPARQRAFAAAARQHAGEFSWQRTADEFEAVCEQLARAQRA